jgi:hypothetical protein
MSKSPSASGAEYRGNADSGDALIEAADQALYPENAPGVQPGGSLPRGSGKGR